MRKRNASARPGEAARREAKHEAELAQAREDAARAEQRARDEVAFQQAREAQEAAAREKDRAHKGKVLADAANAFIEAGLDVETARTVVKLIAKRQIPNVFFEF